MKNIVTHAWTLNKPITPEPDLIGLPISFLGEEEFMNGKKKSMEWNEENKNQLQPE